jgi:hypothetical protein
MMKKIAAALISAAMLCAILAAPALAHEGDDYRAWPGRDGSYEHYNHGEHRGVDEDHPQWAWNNGAEWREHHDWDDSRYRGDWDDHWRDPDRGYPRDYDRR